MMRVSDTARARVGDVARWLTLLRAHGTRVPAVSLVPGTMRYLFTEDATPLQLVDACRRAITAVDRQMAAERFMAAYSLSNRSAAAATVPGGLQPGERQMIWALLREQLTDIVSSLACDGPE